MSPRRYNQRKNDTTEPPPLPPPPKMDTAVTVVVAVDVAQISSSNNGGGKGTNSSNQSENQGHPRECTYKEFTNCKPRPFNGSGGVIALAQWFKKTKSVFEISACPEES